MTIVNRSIEPTDWLGIADKSFSNTCLGSAIDALLNLSESRRVSADDVGVLRDGLASLSLCLSDLMRDRECRLHTDDDMANALTLIASVSQLVSWIEAEDRNIGYLIAHPELVPHA